MFLSDGSPASDALIALHAIGSHCLDCRITIDEVTGWEQLGSGRLVCQQCFEARLDLYECADDEDADDEEDDDDIDEKLRAVIYSIARDIVRLRNEKRLSPETSKQLLSSLQTHLGAHGLIGEAIRVGRIEQTPTPEELAELLAANP